MSFPGGDLDISAIEREALGCTRCALAAGRTQVVWADGNLDSDVLFIGEAPGFHEDKEGRPFVGAAGQLLDKLLSEIGLDRSSVAIVNVLKCRPPGNRDPLPDEIETCTPYLDAQLRHMQPKVIVTLGNFATRYILEQPIGITKARGRVYRRRDAYVVPTFHPAAALRGGRFGGLSPVDGIREDLRAVRTLLDRVEQPPPEPVTAAIATGGEPESQQLGLF
ncbi:MAG: uracil-DNA glycosylase [Actinomycetota bacterium]|jgi:DNA polymerase|nr:uracil-DNA glycosylase [Actinomycetota bacterium]